MSRIHEALKKAEQEKVASQGAPKVELRIEESAAKSVASSVIEIATPAAEIAVAPVLPPESVRQPSPPDARPGNSRFEEIWANCTRTQWKLKNNFLVFSNSNPLHPGSEQFRTLRSRLYKMRETQSLQTILISSSIPAEGKTITAVNLAHALVRQQGCRVLLVDADLRAPRIHTMLGAPGTPGLADYLQNNLDEMQVIQRGHEDGLCFIPAGNHVTHPSELISSKRMKQLLECVKPAFDWIIIDSPPALPVADASVLGGVCDGLLFVVRANSTPSELAQKACKELRGTRILGVVLNAVEFNSEYGSYYSYGAYGLSSVSSKR